MPGIPYFNHSVSFSLKAYGQGGWNSGPAGSDRSENWASPQGSPLRMRRRSSGAEAAKRKGSACPGVYPDDSGGKVGSSRTSKGSKSMWGPGLKSGLLRRNFQLELAAISDPGQERRQDFHQSFGLVVCGLGLGMGKVYQSRKALPWSDFGGVQREDRSCIGLRMGVRPCRLSCCAVGGR